MTKMLTLFGVDLKELKYDELKRELIMQKWIRYAIKSALSLELRVRSRCQNITQTSLDKETFAHIYLQHLEALIAEIEYVMAHKREPIASVSAERKSAVRKKNAAKTTAIIAENKRVYDLKKSMDRDGLLVSWDKDKFMLIAADRGYQTNEALIQAVGKELKLDRARAGVIVDKGRFTWGQVLCLGAMMQMTPKEFCDTFLAGYFTEQQGEYRADYENLCKEELLKRAVKPPINMPPLDIIEVGADGVPVDEEIWF